MKTLRAHPLLDRLASARRILAARGRVGTRHPWGGQDLTGVAALAGIQGPEGLVVSIGFGVDAYHGVSHGLVLENTAALERAGAYPGGGRRAVEWPESAVRPRGSWFGGRFRT